MDFETAFRIALAAAVLYMIHINGLGVEGFQPIRPPYVGGYSSSDPRTVLGSDRTNGGLDRNLIQNAYSQIPSLSVEGTNEQVTAWSVAKHAHHGPYFGLDPSKYGMSQSDLDSIAKKGLINHISQGGKASTVEYVQNLQLRWKMFAEHKNVTRYEDQTVMGQNCAVLKHMKSGLFVSFNAFIGESYTGYKLDPFQSNYYNTYV